MTFFSNLTKILHDDTGVGLKTTFILKKPVSTEKKELPPKTKIVPKIVTKVDNSAAIREAQAKAREIILEAKDEALSIRSEAEKNARKIELQLDKQQIFLEKKLDQLEQRLAMMDKKEKYIEDQRDNIENLKKQIDQNKVDLLKRLEEISGMTKNQARDVLLDGLSKKLNKEMSLIIKQKEEQMKAEADAKASEILIEAMKYAATDYVPEYTLSVIDLPNEELKGKIIGKSGRNIHTFERVTGVDVDLDTSPTEVRLSCFDPIRREVAKEALNRLIQDGRIQPSRIEEQVERAKKEVDKKIFEAGKFLCNEVGVYNIPAGLMKILGKFKYRFSYGQSMITHTIEETKLGVKLAHELKIDVNIVRLGCLLHDVGKVADEVEGNHVELGVNIAKKFGMPDPVIDCIAQHHEDKAFSGPEQMVVYIADAISGARPGARYENFEEYVKRLEDLEAIANSYKEVEQSYAIQAGREVRVLLDPGKSKDEDVTVLAAKIRDEIKEKVIVPGTVNVTVIRESRHQEST